MAEISGSGLAVQVPGIPPAEDTEGGQGDGAGEDGGGTQPDDPQSGGIQDPEELDITGDEGAQTPEGGTQPAGGGEAGPQDDEMSEEEREWRERIAGYETDPETGYLIEPETGILIDPATGQAVESVPLMD